MNGTKTNLSPWEDFKAIRFSKRNLDDCLEFANRDGNVIQVEHRDDPLSLKVMTSTRAFKIHEGEWILKRGFNFLFKLTDREFGSMFGSIDGD